MRDHGDVESVNDRAQSPAEPTAPAGPADPPAPAGPARPSGAAGPSDAAGLAGPPSRRPKTKTVRDMLLSMAVILAGAFGLYLFVPHDASQDPVRPVEYRVEANSAARAAPYELLAPEGLAEEWRATSVRYRHESDHGAFWRLGFMDPENEYVALGQADGPAGPFIAEFTQGAEATTEQVRVAGEAWTRYTGPKYDALVRQTPEVTTVVAGTAPADRLADFAAALAPPAVP